VEQNLLFIKKIVIESIFLHSQVTEHPQAELRIRDVYPGSDFLFPDPHQIESVLTQKVGSQLSEM
jgi:hypothetical protein